MKKWFLNFIGEYKNITWPNRERVFSSMGSVLFFVFVVSTFLMTLNLLVVYLQSLLF